MDSSQTSVGVWCETVLLTAFLVGLVTLYQLHWDVAIALGVAFASLVGGFFLGLPFLLLTLMFVSFIRRLPFSAIGRLLWVFVIESIVVALYFALFEYVTDDHFGLQSHLARVYTAATIAAFLVSLWLNRKGFENKETDTAASTDAPIVASSPTNSAS
ncbi:hypothetical protein [Paraflavitalea pollutisoli]|uniref:hypothetical protein n=1 Tax=Paraflavitalea pollutisoli TaxID=3034143 RepID=UPI0023EBE63C|nr:hypothetical protein [Paraflavitalea sp. H1-2-19X]